MKSFLFLFLLSLRIPKNTFCQWGKNLRQLLSSIFVGVDSYQPRIKGVPGCDVSQLWVPSVWSVRTIIPSVSLYPAPSPSLVRNCKNLYSRSGLIWSVISTSVLSLVSQSVSQSVSQPGKQEMSPVRTETTGLTWLLAPLSVGGGGKVKVSRACPSRSEISDVLKDPIRTENKWSDGCPVSPVQLSVLPRSPSLLRYKNQIKTSPPGRCLLPGPARVEHSHWSRAS